MAELHWLLPSVLATLPEHLTRQLVPRLLQQGVIPDEVTRLVVPALMQVVNNSTANGKDAPAKRRHSAALLTQRGELIFGVNQQHNDRQCVCCAERAAVAAGQSLGRQFYVAVIVYCLDFDNPLICGDCLEILSQHVPPTMATMASSCWFGTSAPELARAMPVNTLLTSSYGAESDRDELLRRALMEQDLDPSSICFAVGPDLVRPFVGDRVADVSARAALKQAVIDRLEVMLSRSTNGCRGTPPEAAVVIDDQGRAFCGTGIKHGNPPNCIEGVQSAVSIGVTAGTSRYRVAIVHRKSCEPDGLFHPFDDTTPAFLRRYLPESGSLTLMYGDEAISVGRRHPRS